MGLEGDELRGIRGNEIAMVFQDPMTSLNPVFTIGQQIVEMIRLHTELTKDQRGTAPPRCSRWSVSREPSNGSTTTRTSSLAACGSGR